MSQRSRLAAIGLVAVVLLSLPAGAIGTVGAQTAGNDAPTPVLDAPDTIERGQLYQLDGSNSTDDDEIVAYYWDYNPDAPTEYQRSTNDSTIYAEDRSDRDQFTVRLGVEDSDGNVAWTNETITVTAAEDPEASIASPDNFTVDREQWETKGATWFNSTSTDNQGIRSCEWTFDYGPTVERTSGDGLGWGAGSTECQKNFSYAVTGTYDVTLTVTDWAGNSNTTTREVEVGPKHEVTDDPQPNAELSAPEAVEWGATYWLNASNSTSEDDVRYYISEHNPDVWQDDERNLGQQTYYGEYYEGQFDRIDVAVGVVTVNDQTDWAWETIDILEPEKPDAVVEGPDAVATGEWGVYDASNSTDNDRIRSYEWTIADAESGETVHTDRGETGNYQFTEPGTYTVTVQVGDWVNHSRDGPYHYGVATKTVTVTEDGEAPNEDPAVSATADSQTVSSGDEVSLSADASDSDGAVQSIDWDLGDGDSATGQSVTHTYDGAGTYTATVTVTDDEGATASDSVDITVEAADGGGGDGDSDDDSSDGQDDSDPPDDTGQSDGPDSSDEPAQDDGGDDQSTSANTGTVGSTDDDEGGAGDEEPAASVEVSRTSDSTTVVDVTDAPADETVEVDLRANGTDEAVEYDHLSVLVGETGNFSLTLTSNEGESGSGAAGAAPGFDGFSSLTVESDDAGTLSDATVQFRVSKERLDAASADTDDVALRRSDDGDFVAVDAEQVDETEHAYVYRAETGKVTSYTVGVERAVLVVTDLSVDSESPTASDPVAVTAKVVNDGQATGTTDVALSMDGEVRTEQSVEVAAGETTTVSFSVPVESAGEHTLSAGDASTTVSVGSQATGTDSTESATEETATATATDDSTPGTNFGGISGFGVVAGLLAIAVGGLLYYRR